MTITMPRMNRLPAQERGLTIGDFLVPIRVSDRMHTRVRHIALVAIGVLRAIGMSRRQVMRMVIVEATVLGIVGAVLGAFAGLGAGAILLQLGGGIGAPSGLPVASIVVAAALGLVLPAIASIYPARAASQVSIVEALHFD